MKHLFIYDNITVYLHKLLFLETLIYLLKFKSKLIVIYLFLIIYNLNF